MNRILPPDELQTLRRETLTALIALAEQHNLPLPMSVHAFPHNAFQIRLDDDHRDDVARWGQVLGCGPIVAMPVINDNSTRVWADRFAGIDGDEPLWLGYRSVTVWSSCDRKGGEQA